MIDPTMVLVWESQAQGVRDHLNAFRLPFLSEWQVKQLENAPHKIRITLICSTDRGRINARSLLALSDCNALTIWEAGRRCFATITDELYSAMNPSPSAAPPIPSPSASIDPPPVTRVSCV